MFIDLAKDDFTGIGRFILPGKDGKLEELDLDLLITSVNIPLQEHHKSQAHIGNTFGVHFFGKAPLVANINATLIDTTDNFGKEYLIYAYTQKLSHNAVAKTGVMPALNVLGILLYGAVTDLQVDELSESPDTINVSFRMLVYKLVVASETATNQAQEATVDFTGNSGAEISGPTTPTNQYSITAVDSPYGR